MHYLFLGRRVYFATGWQMAWLGLLLLALCSSYSLSTGLAATRRLAGSDHLTIGVWVPDHDLVGEKKLLSSLSRSAGTAYHHWLSAADFQARFAPTAGEIATVQNFLTGAGLRVLPTSSSNLLLASGTVSQVEHTFSTSSGIGGLNTPEVPAAFAPLVTGVFGLANQPLAHTNDLVSPSDSKPGAVHAIYGGGVHGSGLTPSQVAHIYNAAPLYRQGNRGQGTTLGLFELSGYKGSDIAAYEDTYHLPHVPLVNIPVLGGPSDHSGAAEVELDIDLQIAMAPGARRLLVYNAPNRKDLDYIMTYDRIAEDNLADAISTSWGNCEYLWSTAYLQAENQIFLRMALQGQSMFAASGDGGAYDCAHQNLPLLPPTGQELQVDDPGEQPYVTAAGGTSFQGAGDTPLYDPGKNQYPAYPGRLNEKPWSSACFVAWCNLGASGGGVSRLWGEPDYALNQASGKYYPGVVGWYSRSGSYCQQRPGVLCREIPDVSLNADPRTGYSIYCTDTADSSCSSSKTGWLKLGGTSATSPLWAGIAALAIHQNGNQRLGLLNYQLYPLDSSDNSRHQFHDIISNLRTGLPFQNALGHPVTGYAATRHYDLSTGIGTPDIARLVESLAPAPVAGNG